MVGYVTVTSEDSLDELIFQNHQFQKFFYAWMFLFNLLSLKIFNKIWKLLNFAHFFILGTRFYLVTYHRFRGSW